MSGSVVAGRARRFLFTIFAAFLVVNVWVLTMAFLAHLRGDASLLPPHLGAETSMGVRFGLVLIGAIASWFFARMLYKTLVKHEVGPSDAVGPSFSLLSYLILVLAAYAFLGYGTWLWLPVLFLIVLVWSLISLWTLVGWDYMLVALFLAALTGFLTWYFGT